MKREIKESKYSKWSMKTWNKAFYNKVWKSIKILLKFQHFSNSNIPVIAPKLVTILSLYSRIFLAVSILILSDSFFFFLFIVIVIRMLKLFLKFPKADVFHLNSPDLNVDFECFSKVFYILRQQFVNFFILSLNAAIRN